MNLCQVRLIVEGIREWQVGTCDRQAKHTPPHHMTTKDVQGRTVEITWRDDEDGIRVSAPQSSS